ncbi:hypothetical protein R1sor_020121 [Riccia sorocarpa]|uniref:F-box domain-containing protein n=1 Tax=Riccia sorocarpa TaxID=122646 RepID=A0ABD3IG45_9MARC
MYFLRPRSKRGFVEDKRVLNSQLWSSLPDDLIERVLIRVPFSALLKCRTVCKRWNELILSRNFIPADQDPPKCIPFHFTFYSPPEDPVSNEGRYFTAYDTRRNSWVDLSLSFLDLDPEMGNWEMAASGGGLLCLASMACSRFVVCNPVTKKWRLLEIPCQQSDKPLLSLPPSDNEYHPRPLEHLLVGLVVCQDSGHYKLVVAEIYEFSQHSTFVYDSRTRVWREGAKTPALPNSCFSRKPGISRNGALYWIGDDENWCCPRLFKYEVENDSWTDLLLTTYGWDVRLLEHRNELTLVTEDGQACILHESGEKMCLKQKTLPKSLREKLVRQPDGRVQNSSCLGAGDVICFVREVITERKYGTRLEFVVRDFSCGSSTATPSLEHSYVLLCWIMEPSLTAIEGWKSLEFSAIRKAGG